VILKSRAALLLVVAWGVARTTLNNPASPRTVHLWWPQLPLLISTSQSYLLYGVGARKITINSKVLVASFLPALMSEPSHRSSTRTASLLRHMDIGERPW
jgi:hypothetical protein